MRFGLWAGETGGRDAANAFVLLHHVVLQSLFFCWGQVRYPCRGSKDKTTINN